MSFKTFTSGAVLTAAELNTYLMEQANIVCTSATRPASPVEGMHIFETDTDKTYVYSGAAWVEVSRIGAWTSFTPSITQSGSITTSSLSAKYVRLGGRTIHFSVYSILSSAGTTANALKYTLPTNHSAAGYVVGPVWIYDESVGTAYTGVARTIGTNQIEFFTSSGTSSWGVSPNVAVANGDYVMISGTYEADA